MATYRVNGPNGEVYRVTAPEGASLDDVIAYAQAQHASTPKVTADGMRKALGVKTNVGDDMRKSGISGLAGSLVAMNPQNSLAVDAPLDMIRRAAGVADFVQNAIKGRPTAPIANVAMPGSTIQPAIQAASRMDHQPQTVQGRAAHFVGAALPAVLAPGSAATRVANVIAPAAGAFLTGEAARAAGAPDSVRSVLETLGGLGAGIGANVRLAPNTAPKLEAPQAQSMAYLDRITGATDPGALQAPHPMMTAAEALGQRGKAALGALARREGTTGDALNAEVATRSEGRPQRILSAFTEAAGVDPHAAAGDMKALVEKGRADAAPLYDAAYAVGPIDTPKLQLLASRPSMRRAMSRAVRIAAEEGRDPTELGFKLVKRGAGTTARDTAVMDWPEGSDGRFQVTGSKTVHDPQMADVSVQVESPTTQTWDYVKRGLDDVLEGYRDKTTGKLVLDEEGRAILATLKEFRGELTNANPLYGKALATSADYLSADNAFRSASRDILNGNLTEHQFVEKLAAMSPGERVAYRGGIANKFFDLAQNGRLNPRALQTPRVRMKLRAALGPDAADRLISKAEQEAQMQAFETRYAPNAQSITQHMKAAMAEQDGTGGLGGELFTDMVRGGPRHAAGQQVGKLLAQIGPTRGLSEAARNHAGESLMMSPEDFASLIADYRANKPSPLLQRLHIRPNLFQPEAAGTLGQAR